MDKEKINTVIEKVKSFKKFLIPIVVIIIAVLASFITFSTLQLSLNTQTPVVVVSSGSMSPTLNEGDMLFVKGVDGSEIQNESIIVFHAIWSSDPSIPVVHRVIGIHNYSGVLYFETKGDNNEIPDPYFVREEFVYGVVIGGIPYIGWIKLIFDRSGLLYIILIIIIFYLGISMIFDYIKEKENERNVENGKDLQKYKEDTKTLN
ncbi:MAG: signal peptidase I [Promethearchaeota archaeon]